MLLQHIHDIEEKKRKEKNRNERKERKRKERIVIHICICICYVSFMYRFMCVYRWDFGLESAIYAIDTLLIILLIRNQSHCEQRGRVIVLFFFSILNLELTEIRPHRHITIHIVRGVKFERCQFVSSNTLTHYTLDSERISLFLFGDFQ